MHRTNTQARIVHAVVLAATTWHAKFRFFHDGRDATVQVPASAGFGTVHGFGFAGALTEANLPASGILTAPFSFNLGVELGQLLALAIALPLVLRLRRSLWFPRFAVPALSGLILR